MNKDLFSQVSHRNEAGGKAYKLTPLHALAQYAFTGTFYDCFYVNARMQLDSVIELCNGIDNVDIAKVAIASRDGYMKDMPAALCAYLHSNDAKLLSKIFNRVIDNGKMLVKFVKMVESGHFGRKSFGTTTKRAIQNWFANRDASKLLWDYGNMGGKMAQMLKKFHPRPESKEKEAFYAWIAGWEKNKDGESVLDNYPECLQEYEAFKKNPTGEIPNIPPQLLEGLITKDGWKTLAKNGSWQYVRQSLNRFQRHGVFDDDAIVHSVASKLRDENLISKSNVFPYQLLATYMATQPKHSGLGWGWYSEGKKGSNSGLPQEIVQSLERATEIATANVPSIDGDVCIAVDISGSMQIPVTGASDKGGMPSSNVRCVDAAALILASIVRKNPMANVLAFNRDVYSVDLDFSESILKNVEKFVKMHGGGTSCHAPLAEWNASKANADVVIYISDYESWADPKYSDQTAMQKEWASFKKRCPKAKMICIDLAPRKTGQVKEQRDVFYIGGMSDTIFSHMNRFLKDEFNGQHWVEFIQKVKI